MRVVSKGVADVHRFIPVAVAMLAATAVGGLAGSASASENYVRCDMPTEHLDGKTYIDRITTTSSVCLKYDGQIIGPAHSTHPKPKPVSKSRSCPFAAGSSLATQASRQVTVAAFCIPVVLFVALIQNLLRGHAGRCMPC